MAIDDSSTISTPATPLKIAIIGAGPGGLTLSRLLQLENIPFTLYDRDGGPTERNQGGTLDLHHESGQLALRTAGLEDEFKKKARFDGDCMKLVKFDGTVVLDEEKEKEKENEHKPGDPGVEGSPHGRPEIDRLQLRDMLLDSLLPCTVQWGYKLLKVEAHLATDQVSHETYTLYFLHAGQEIVEGPFDIVIGADGANSKLRPLLTTEQPFYSGISMVELWALDVDSKNPWLSKYIGPGSAFMWDAGRGTFAQRNGDGSIRVYACVQQPEAWFENCNIEWSSPTKARQQLVDGYFSDCGEDIKNVILQSNDRIVLRKLEMLPIGISWNHRGGLTLLGDAAHLMTPFAGEGVNNAMHDALDLSLAIIRGVRHGKNGMEGVTEELAEYEKVMFERSKEKAQTTWDQLHNICFAKDGIEAFLEFLKSMGPPEEEEGHE